MNSEPILINRVNQSGLVTIKLEDFFPTHEIKEFDLKDYLFQGLILKEMDFRKALKEHHWDQYQNCYLTVFCSTDAITVSYTHLRAHETVLDIVCRLLLEKKKKKKTKKKKNKIHTTHTTQSNNYGRTHKSTRSVRTAT